MTIGNKRVSFYYPTGSDRWTDEAITGLIGQECSVTLHDAEMGNGKVISARRDDRQAVPLPNPNYVPIFGIWIDVEVGAA